MDFRRDQYQFTNLASLTLDTRIWRYMPFEKFCWLIETSKLWHTRLDKFNDPFEGSVTEKYRELRDTEEIESVTLKEYEPWMNKCYRLRCYACCWHASPHESDAQWQIYAAGGAGVAIVSTLKRLQNAVDITPHPHGLLSRVDYVDFKDHLMLSSFAERLRPEFVKRKSFEHEREVRGVILKEMCVLATAGGKLNLDDALVHQMRTENPPGIPARVNLSELLEAIVISPLATGYVKELVRIVAKRHGFEGLVRESELCGEPVF